MFLLWGIAPTSVIERRRQRQRQRQEVWGDGYGQGGGEGLGGVFDNERIGDAISCLCPPPPHRLFSSASSASLGAPSCSHGDHDVHSYMHASAGMTMTMTMTMTMPDIPSPKPSTETTSHTATHPPTDRPNLRDLCIASTRRRRVHLCPPHVLA